MDAQTRTAIIETTTTLNQLVDNLESLFTQLVEKPAGQFVGVEPVGDGLYVAYFSKDDDFRLTDGSQIICICDDAIAAADAVDIVTYIMSAYQPNFAALYRIANGNPDNTNKAAWINPWFEVPSDMSVSQLYSCIMDIATTGEDPMNIMDGEWGLQRFLEIYSGVNEEFEELLDDIAEAAEEETLADELDALIESIQNPVSFEDILAEAISILVSNAK